MRPNKETNTDQEYITRGRTGFLGACYPRTAGTRRLLQVSQLSPVSQVKVRPQYTAPTSSVNETDSRFLRTHHGTMAVCMYLSIASVNSYTVRVHPRSLATSFSDKQPRSISLCQAH